MVAVLDRVLGVQEAGSATSGEGPRSLAGPEALGRSPEAVCRRCRQPWRVHQEGTRKNRSALTGCTTFQD